MALSTTTLTPAIVAAALGIDTSNGITLKTLCTSSAINKWSKHKPVVNSSKTALTESQFLGEKTEYGYYYGVHLATANNDYTEIESVGFEYEQPTEDFRLGDFRGYEHNAVCSLVGIISGMTEGTGIICTVSSMTMQDTDDGSIDYGAMVEDKTGVALDNFYVMALVQQDGDYWVRACNTQSGGVIATIGNNTDGGWAIPVQDIDDLNRGTGATAVVSLFLLQSLAYNGNSSYFSSWRSVSSGQLFTYQGFAVPEAVAKTKSVAKTSTYNGTILLDGSTSASIAISASTAGSVSILASVAWTCTYVSTYDFTMSLTSGSASSLARAILFTTTSDAGAGSMTTIYFKDSSGVKRAELTVNIVSDLHIDNGDVSEMGDD